MRISECPVLPCIVSIWRTSVQPSAGRSTMNAVLAAWAISGSSSVRATRMAKLARWALEMNHLWPLITHSSPSGVGVRADQRRVRAGHLRLGHGEARPRRPLAQRAQVALLLLVGAEVQQRVHVALVGRLAVEHPRPVVRPRRLGLDHRQGDVAEAHAAPLRWHVRQPQSGLTGRRSAGRAARGSRRPGPCRAAPPASMRCSAGRTTSSTKARTRPRSSSSSAGRLKSIAIVGTVPTPGSGRCPGGTG